MTGHVWIIIEQWRGRVSDVAYEGLALGREIADQLGTPLDAVLLGHNVHELTTTLGAADSVLYADHPDLHEPVSDCGIEPLEQLARERSPGVILIPLTNVSLGVGTLLAARFGVPAVNFCRDLRVVDGHLEARCLMYGGKMECVVSADAEPAIIGLWPGIRPAEKGRSDRVPHVEDIVVRPPPARVRLAKYIEPPAGDVDLTQQEVLVGVGRGIQGENNIAMAEELAAEFGGAVCGSRPVVDQGWLPLSRQVGKSGIIVKPKLYFALGISGAPEHVEGMRDAGVVVAVNTDPGAPIFDIAQYGVVSDVLDFIPALADAVRAKKAQVTHA